jgi:glucosamine--fructose-6-phosphate aminotransferase (isomerizing)
MCGILGFAIGKKARLTPREMRGSLEQLFLLSESRGKESAGLHVCLPDSGASWTLKGDLPASRLIKTPEYREVIKQLEERVYGRGQVHPLQPMIVIAHSRLVTNGSADYVENNQPVGVGSISMVHNGIIVNVNDLWAKHDNLERTAEVDTEIMAALLYQECCRENPPITATKRVYEEIRGAASIAWINDGTPCLTLATNTGDLYYRHDQTNSLIMFASEAFILRGITALGADSAHDVLNLKAGQIVTFDADKQALHCFGITGADESSFAITPRNLRELQHQIITVNSRTTRSRVTALRQVDLSLLRYNEANIRSLRRCSRCILPETFPFIYFDEQGVCNYCHGYRPKYLGVDCEKVRTKFLQQIEVYRSKHREPDVLVPFSGGRDSCYGLHLIKKEFGFQPVTYTYDWGMVTDLARRNIARMCGALGVQNILVSADIKKKRDNIRRNVVAWLTQPDLGLVPLFMAGDKQFFKVVNKVKKQTGIRLDLWSANPLENTDFKSGFCGVPPDFSKHRVDYLSFGRKIQMVGYYGVSFLRNPRYMNISVIDTIEAFLSYYFEPRRNFFFMFNHLVWDEDVVNSVLLNQYDFERSPDSASTWRIGDGTAPFYNYIYMTARGFTEFDTFRSNQIREGMISRQDALDFVLVENRPRAESLRWYLEAIGLDFNSVIKRVNQIDLHGLHESS